MQAYQSGKLSIQVPALLKLARLLSSTLEKMFGQQPETTVAQTGPGSKMAAAIAGHRPGT